MSDTSLPQIEAGLRVLSEAQTAELLSVHTQTLRKWRRARQGPPHINLGPRRLGYRAADVLAWQEARRAA